MSIQKPVYKAGQTINTKLAISNGIVGGWLLNENTGISNQDSSGNNHPAAFAGTPNPTWTTGAYNAPALLFPASSTTNSTANMTLALPMSAMVLFTSTVAGRNNESLLTFGTNVCRFSVNNGNPALFFVYNGSASLNIPNASLPFLAGVPYIAVYTINSSGNCTLTVNSVTVSGAVGTSVPTGIVEIGNNTAQTGSAEATIDGIVVWNRIVTPTETASLMLDPFQMYKNTSNLSLYFKLI